MLEFEVMDVQPQVDALFDAWMMFPPTTHVNPRLYFLRRSQGGSHRDFLMELSLMRFLTDSDILIVISYIWAIFYIVSLLLNYDVA